jgi:hypothetical protein
MKYITFHTGTAVPGVVLFSGFSHAEVAHMVGKRVLGAGFVTIPDAKAFTGGISTSLLVGPSDADAKAIEFELDRTAREYPAPTPARVMDRITAPFPTDQELAALSPAERAAFLGTKAPAAEHCYNCGRVLTPENRFNGNTACVACEGVMAERFCRGVH